MFNILPQQEKKKILTEYHLRLGVVLVFAIAALVFSSLALLGPSYFLAISKHKFASNDLARLEAMQGSVTQGKDVDTAIKMVNRKIALFLKTEKTPRLILSETVLGIITTKNPAVKIEGFMYDGTADRERIVLSGSAADRENLALFAEALKKDKTFTSVMLPISSYVKSTDIDFSIVLERTLKPVSKKQ